MLSHATWGQPNETNCKPVNGSDLIGELNWISDLTVVAMGQLSGSVGGKIRVCGG